MPTRELGVGQYDIVLRDAKGTELRRVSRYSTQRFPQTGDLLELEGASYRVTEVRHVDEQPESGGMYQYTELLIVATALPSVPVPPPRGATDRDEPIAPSSDKGSRATPVAPVLPFRPVAFDAASPLAAFHSLLAWAVAIGYREQAHLLESLKVEAWHLEWIGKRWIVSRLTGGLDAAQLRGLSRQAAQQEQLAFAFFVASLEPAVHTEPVTYANVIALRPRVRRGDRTS